MKTYITFIILLFNSSILDAYAHPMTYNDWCSEKFEEGPSRWERLSDTFIAPVRANRMAEAIMALRNHSVIEISAQSAASYVDLPSVSDGNHIYLVRSGTAAPRDSSILQIEQDNNNLTFDLYWSEEMNYLDIVTIRSMSVPYRTYDAAAVVITDRLISQVHVTCFAVR